METIIENTKQKIIENIEILKDFELWSFNYLVKDVDIIEKSINETKQIFSLLQHSDTKEVVRFKLDKLEEAKIVTNNYRDRLKVSEDDENRLWQLQIKTYDILKECGFKRLGIIDVNVDMTINKDRVGYYVTGYKKIFIQKSTIDDYCDREIIEILLHEYIHAWIDINFSKIDKNANDDDSIIFGCIICRLNRKLKRLGYDYKVRQNGFREALVKWNYTKEMNILSDLRKNIKTLSFDIIEMIDKFNSEYGTVNVLADKI